MQKTEFTIKYDTKDHEVKLATLLHSLSGFEASMKEISKTFAPNETVEFTVKAIQPGSFLVSLGIAAAEAAPLIFPFFKEAVSFGDAMISILVNLIELRKHTKGEPPSKVYNNNDQVYIENNQGNVYVINQPVFNFAASNQSVDQALTEVFRSLEKDGEIMELELTSGQEILTKVKKSDYGYMAKPFPVQQYDKMVQLRAGVKLQVSKANFDETGKWSFWYDGNKISAEISDKVFYKQIEAGQLRFTKGDVLLVDLEILQVYDPKEGVYANKAYKVAWVKEHIPRPNSLDLFDVYEG